ncbi:MAG: substrate-binding domain-containing protein [Luteolibacter sp.]
MRSAGFSSITEQVAAHLREELLRGRWRDNMPGRNQLFQELGVSTRTVELAFQILEKEGLLAAQGAGRRRRIMSPASGMRSPQLQVALLMTDYAERVPNLLHHQLTQAGHRSFFTEKTLLDLGMDVERISRFVREVRADAWVVASGSRDVLQWFASQEVPAIAMFGNRHGLPIAGVGPDKVPAFADVTRRLIRLGHGRISLIGRRQIRLPQPHRVVRAFLRELEAAGIAANSFNLPDWEESGSGLEKMLDSLFRTTPPTALILCEPFVYHAAHHYLARRGLRVPADVSLVCTDGHHTFTWCRPTIAHIRWDYRPVLRRIVRWANHIARGKEDRRQTLSKAEFVDGETVGPAPKR